MKNPIATAPPPPRVPPPPMAIPVINITPFVECEYTIFSRCSVCCWREIFKLKKNKTDWILYIVKNESVFKFNKNKTNEEITCIIISLGVKIRRPYRVVVSNNDNIVQDRFFISLPKLINFITTNEIIIEDVLVN